MSTSLSASCQFHHSKSPSSERSQIIRESRQINLEKSFFTVLREFLLIVRIMLDLHILPFKDLTSQQPPSQLWAASLLRRSDCRRSGRIVMSALSAPSAEVTILQAKLAEALKAGRRGDASC